MRSSIDNLVGLLDNMFRDFIMRIICSLISHLMSGLQLVSLRLRFMDYLVRLWANRINQIILCLMSLSKRLMNPLSFDT